MISVIVPCGPEEQLDHKFLQELAEHERICEILLVGGSSFESMPSKVKILSVSTWGRAYQLNQGATSATCSWLLFLHADSRLRAGFFLALNSLALDPSILYYFDLHFYDVGNLLGWQELGAKFRSDILGMPFGDQGLLVAKKVWHDLEGFDASLGYGEDHDFIWRARLKRLKLKALGPFLSTSARKYRVHGRKLTWQYLKMTAKQAWPYFFKLIKNF